MSERDAASPARGFRVVLAEDSPTEAACLEFLLMKNGYEVTVAEDGEAALEAVRTEAPDLIISDVIMPRLDGYGVCDTLKVEATTTHIPVMLLTGLHDTANVLRGLACGADDFLLKPYDEGTLLARIGALLSSAHAGSTPREAGDILVEFEGETYAIAGNAPERVRLLLSALGAEDSRHDLLAEIGRRIEAATKGR